MVDDPMRLFHRKRNAASAAMHARGTIIPIATFPPTERADTASPPVFAGKGGRGGEVGEEETEGGMEQFVPL